MSEEETKEKYTKVLLREGLIGQDIILRKDVKDITVEKIVRNPNQPRIIFDETALKELTKSIASFGIIEPIVVRPKQDLFEIVLGERRFRAGKRAKLKMIPCIVKELDDHQAFQMALTENVHREDLTPIDEAHSYNYMLKDNMASSIREIAKKLGVSHVRIIQKMNLLKLPQDIQQRVVTRVTADKKPDTITEGHARHLLKLKDPGLQLKLFEQITKNDLSTRQVEKRVTNLLTKGEKKEEKEEKRLLLRTQQATLKWSKTKGYTITIKPQANLISALEEIIQKLKPNGQNLDLFT